MTLDYYSVAIDKAIATIGESTILAGCYSGRNPEFCPLIERGGPKNQITNIVNLNQNVGKEDSAGIDLSLRYDLRTANAAASRSPGIPAWLQKHDQTLADGTVVNGKGTFDLQAQRGRRRLEPRVEVERGGQLGPGAIGAGVATKFVSAFKECGAD